MGRVDHVPQAQAELANVYRVIDELALMIQRMVPRTYAPSTKKAKAINASTNTLASLLRSIPAKPEPAEVKDPAEAAGQAWRDSLFASTQQSTKAEED